MGKWRQDVFSGAIVNACLAVYLSAWLVSAGTFLRVPLNREGTAPKN
ncbi:hypothetical protein [Dyadobacter frigoris]|nr:hypothetical protein [Dyadobacter frigoris]